MRYHSLVCLLLLSLKAVLCHANSDWNIGDVRVVTNEGILAASHGILQVYLEDGWFTATYDGVSANAASVACRQLAYTGALNYSGDGNFQDPDHKYITNIKCESTETGSVLRCGYALDKVPGNDHTSLKIYCNTASILEHSYNGQVYINRTDIAWSKGIVMMNLDNHLLPVCSDNVLYSCIADSVCRQLGYTTALSFASDENLFTPSKCWKVEVDINCGSSHPCLTNCFKHYSMEINHSFMIKCDFDVTKSSSASAGTAVLISVFTVTGFLIFALLFVIALVCIMRKFYRRGYHRVDRRILEENNHIQVSCAAAASDT